MKKVVKNNIVNIEDTDLFDNKFLFEYLEPDFKNTEIEVVYMSDLLESRKNEEILKLIKDKPATYSNVYSPKDELEIFIDLFDNAIKNNQKIHIIGITLDEEVKILEEYYFKLGFMREDINSFDVDFSIPLITASVKIENIMWKGSDYKAQRSKIFFNPPIRESGQVKSMFKGINRGIIASIHITTFKDKMDENIENFLSNCIKGEKILALTLSKVFKFNLLSIGFRGIKKELVIDYNS